MSISNIIAFAKTIIGIKEATLNGSNTSANFDIHFKLYDEDDVDETAISDTLKNIGAEDIVIIDDWDGVDVRFNIHKEVKDLSSNPTDNNITIRCNRCGVNHKVSIASVPSATWIGYEMDRERRMFSYRSDRDDKRYFDNSTSGRIGDTSLIQIKYDKRTQRLFTLENVLGKEYLLCDSCMLKLSTIRSTEYPTDTQAKKALREFLKEDK